MSTDDDQQSNQTMYRLEKILNWLEKKPASWVILGLFLFFASSGGVTFKFSDNTFSVGEPNNEVFQAVLLCLSIVILFIGLGILLTKNYKYKNILLAILIVSTIIPQYFIIKEVVSDPANHKTIREWEYNPKTSEVETQLSSVALESSKYENLVLAVRKRNPAIDFKNDKNVVIGNIFTVPSRGDPNLRKNISVTKLGPSIGEEIEIYLLAIQNEDAIKKATTIGEIINSGGESLDKSWLTVLPDLENPNHLYNIFSNLSEKNKTIFKNKAWP